MANQNGVTKILQRLIDAVCETWSAKKNIETVYEEEAAALKAANPEVGVALANSSGSHKVQLVKAMKKVLDAKLESKLEKAGFLDKIQKTVIDPRKLDALIELNPEVAKMVEYEESISLRVSAITK